MIKTCRAVALSVPQTLRKQAPSVERLLLLIDEQPAPPGNAQKRMCIFKTSIHTSWRSNLFKDLDQLSDVRY